MSYRSSRYSSRYEDRWPAYVPVAERRRKAEKEMDKLRKKGVPVSPVKIEGKKIATTFWGKAWCDNLESYRDYENRLERGRTYVRNGSVVDLQVAPREVTAMVSGSSIYKVRVSIGEVTKGHWKSICADCAGGIDSLVELLQGRFSKGVMERICHQGTGLFPKPSEIRFTCSCPDYAVMCKHVAAVLYGVGARLDAQPELLFRLRAVDENDLVADIGDALPMTKQGPGSGKVLEADDMAALFGLEMGGEEAAPEAGGKAAAKPATRSKQRLSARARQAAATETAPAVRREASSRPQASSHKTVVRRKAASGPAVPEASTLETAPVKRDSRPKASPRKTVARQKATPEQAARAKAAASRKTPAAPAEVPAQVQAKTRARVKLSR